MNYLAHAWPILQSPTPDPYELAGVATPDWLSVASRKIKCRSRMAAPLADDPNPRTAAIARGVVRHHADDGWFHESRRFNELSLKFAKKLREELSEATSMRPWFLGHILVELLLDDALATREPDLLDRYYKAVGKADAEYVAGTVERFCGQRIERLSEWIGRFVEIRFLQDYATDTGLTLRLNQVMKRVGLPQLPETFAKVLPGFRADVNASVDELLHPSGGLLRSDQTLAMRPA